MDEVVAFAKRYLQDLYAIELAFYEVTDDDKYQALVDKFDGYFDMVEGSRKERWDMPPKSVAARGIATKKEFSPGTLFLVRQYELPKLGTIYRAYTSQDRHPGYKSGYFHTLWIQRQKGGLKIVSIDSRCPDCDGTGVLNGKSCRACSGAGYHFVRGVEIGDPGAPVAVKRVEPPENPADRADYDSDAPAKKPSKKR